MEHKSTSYPSITKFPLLIELIFLLLIIFITYFLGYALSLFVVDSIFQQDSLELLKSQDKSLLLENHNQLRWLLGANNFFTFLIPSILFAILIYKKKWAKMLGIAPQKSRWRYFPKQVLIGIVLLTVSLPLVALTLKINQAIPLPDYLQSSSESVASKIEALMTMPHLGFLLLNLFMLALVPAVGEELIFRGYLQKRLGQFWKNNHLTVWIVAIVFSAIHFQFDGFLARMLLGALLGYLMLYTQNLWVPIIAHLWFNGSQIIINYYYNRDAEKTIQDQEYASLIFIAIFSLLLVSTMMFLLYKNRSPQIISQEKEYQHGEA